MSRRECVLCAGTGWLALMNSWFIYGGMRRERCGICGGNGKSKYRPPREDVRRQAELRARLAEIGTKPHFDKMGRTPESTGRSRSPRLVPNAVGDALSSRTQEAKRTRDRAAHT